MHALTLTAAALGVLLAAVAVGAVTFLLWELLRK